MSSSLDTERVQAVLERLITAGEQEDASYSANVRAREAQLGGNLYGLERAQLGARAPQAIAPLVGRILYALTIAKRPALVVEFGASLGYSTVCLASAVHDLKSGRIVSTELIAEKADAATQNLASAGLDHLVDLRQGDAKTTLTGIDKPIDLLFLDGSNDLYLPILEMLEPQLASDAVIVADLSHGDPHHALYRDYVNDPARRYVTTEIPVDAGLVVSTVR